MISSIVAIEKNQGIGYKNSMPWPTLSEDLKWFKSITLNNVVIMGSNTWRSLKKPLPNRINIVISKNVIDNADHVFQNIDAAILFSLVEYKDKEIFVIGGQQLYDSTMNIIDKFYITEINETYQCDKFFNFEYVKNHFNNIKIIASYTQPVNYTIKAYTK